MKSSIKPDWTNGEAEVPLNSPSLLPGDKTPSYQTLKRYALHGLRSKYSNNIVVLGSWQEGSSLFTTKEAWVRFTKKLNPEWDD